MIRSRFVEVGEVKSGDFWLYLFSGGWGVSSVFFGFRLSDMTNVRTVRFCT